MKRLYLLFLLVLLNELVFSQWIWQNPLPQGNVLNKVFFVDSSNGWAAGDAGAILRTTDGGAKWSIQNSGTNINLTDIYFISPNMGWAVADDEGDANSFILSTTNGGKNWSQQNTGLQSGTNTFDAVFFSDSLTGYLAGAAYYYNGWSSAILKTTDGGVKWNTVAVEDTGYDYKLNAIYFSDKMNGWAVGLHGIILHTTNGGDSWSQQTSNTTSEFNSVYFVDSQNGWISGYQGVILHTTDGGTTWKPQNSGGGFVLTDVHFTDLNNGWISTNDNSINGIVVLHTTNGGANWSQEPIDVFHNLNSVYFVNNKIGWVVGNAGIIFKTTDSGNSWNIQTSGPNDGFLDVSFANDSLGIAVGPVGYSYLTTDKGENWSESFYDNSLQLKKSKSFMNPDPDSIYQGKFVDKQFMGIKMGSELILGSPPGITVRKISLDTSYNIFWQHKYIPSSQWLFALATIDTSNIWVAGDSGAVSYSSNLGDTWKEQNSGVTSSLQDAFFADSLDGWIVGYDGTIINTTNGGQTWNTQESGTSQILWSVHFLDKNNGWVVGDGGTILHTTNGGNSWITVPSNNFNNLHGIDFSDNMHGWIVGLGGIILNTTDGGQTWNRVPNITTNDLLAVDFVDNNNGWVVGTGGTILHFSGNTTGINNNPTNKIPFTFKLEQNYPNPFNPSTVISYQLAVGDHVTLKVYDILGREVATLVNRKQRAGSYKVNFNAGRLSSGVYFYRLNYGDYSATKKMIVLR